MSDAVKEAPKIPNERRQLVTLIGRQLWQMNLDPEEKLTKEGRQANWKEHGPVFMRAARRILTNVEKRGFKFTKTPV